MSEWQARGMFEAGDAPPIMKFKRAESMYEFDLNVEGPMTPDPHEARDEW